MTEILGYGRELSVNQPNWLQTVESIQKGEKGFHKPGNGGELRKEASQGLQGNLNFKNSVLIGREVRPSD